jgi:uncharacterized protein YjaZ
MIEPYWPKISEWAMGDTNHLKPPIISDGDIAEKIKELYHTINISRYEQVCKQIIDALPKDDEDSMIVAFYPSDNRLPEGIYGTGVWGNVILNVNPLNIECQKWIPFVFAHEYHHCVYGFYWYCQRGGADMKGIFLEYLISEGEADAFAQSLYPDMQPSWHSGVTDDEVEPVWDKIKGILYKQLPVEDSAKYMFGNEELGIPQNAGYYFAIRIVKAYLKRNPNTTFSELIKVPHEQIFMESGYRV